MNILAIETAAEACSVALVVNGHYYHHYEIAPQQHATLLLPMLDALLKEACIKASDLQGLAYGHGPGSFTGVRIAASTVQGIALGCDLPVVGVSTLKALAHRAWREQGCSHSLCAIDARMREVYFAAYETQEQGVVKLISKEVVCAPEHINVPNNAHWTGIGTGWSAYEQALKLRCGEALKNTIAEFFPHALDVLMLAEKQFANGKGVPAEQAMPVYLRDKVAFTTKERTAAKVK
jgi:tRNA threonylcarbamoyladenosine biosynthesis protein TsaB